MKISNILLWLAVLIIGGWLVFNSVQTNQTFKGVTVGNEYTATTTPDGGVWLDGLIKAGWGSLGSVTITLAGDTAFTLYDATSTAAIASWQGTRTNSTQQLAVIPASLVAGTYTYDVTFTEGLVIDVVSGTLGTSTIAYR